MTSYNSTTSNKYFEVSIFGGGVGEGILIRLPNKKWIVIDSCINPKTKKAVALEYLEQQKVSLQNDIWLIIATHWHDDHIRGLFQIIEKSPNAKLAFSTALQKEECLSLIATDEGCGGTLKEFTSGTAELNKIFTYLMDNNSTTRVSWASADKLLQRDVAEAIAVYSLSPSDYQTTLAFQHLASFLPEFRASKRIIPESSPNHASVVLWIEIGSFKLLLGADLENSNIVGCGWDEILKSETKPTGKAKIFKVPHHGSSTAHNEGVWGKMVDSTTPYAFLTPYARSHIPKDDEIKCLIQKTPNVFITASPQGKKGKISDRAVEKTIKEVTKSYSVFDLDVGQIKFQYDISSAKETIEMFGSAKKLNNDEK